MRRHRIPRLVIGAPRGRSGKTTVTMAVLAALVQGCGLAVQPFKKGPDFIDPGWLTRVAGRPCRNLDGFLFSRRDIYRHFLRHSLDADVAVVEGAMGLFDGVDLEGSGSTAEIAKIIRAPVVLVVDATRMTRSVAALVQGFMHFDPQLHVAGVILNRVARARHEKMLCEAVRRYCGLPVLGVVPKGKELTIPDRHLGLVPPGEKDELLEVIPEITRVARECLDVEALLQVARSAPPLELPEDLAAEERKPRADGPAVGVIRDRAFSFYYPENLEALEEAGARLVYIDALRDTALPDVNALYIGGGFPEELAPQLEANEGLRADVRRAVEEGLPVYAECGGLMYLGRCITWRGKSYRMCGALPYDVRMEERPLGHGYEVVEVAEENPYFPVGIIIKGHEFHHSRLEGVGPGLRYAFRVQRGYGIDGRRDGLVYKNVLAAYNHLHALSVPSWAAALVEKASRGS